MQTAWVKQAFLENVPYARRFSLPLRNWGLWEGVDRTLPPRLQRKPSSRTLTGQYTSEQHYQPCGVVVVARNYLVDMLRRETAATATRCRLPCPRATIATRWPKSCGLCLAELPPADAELIRMTYDEGQTLDQIAAGMPADERSANARRLGVRNWRLTIERRLAECLRSESVHPGKTTTE